MYWTDFNMSADSKLFLDHFLGKDTLFNCSPAAHYNIIVKDTIMRLPQNIWVSDEMRPYNTINHINYQGLNLTTEGLVKLGVAGTHIDFEVAPQLEGFIIGKSGQTLLNIRNVEGKLNQRYDTHRPS